MKYEKLRYVQRCLFSCILGFVFVPTAFGQSHSRTGGARPPAKAVVGAPAGQPASAPALVAPSAPATGGKSASKTGRETTYDFEDDLVTGDLVRPDGELLSVRRRGNRTSLIRIREHFIPEMLKSVENL